MSERLSEEYKPTREHPILTEDMICSDKMADIPNSARPERVIRLRRPQKVDQE